jgi:phosphoadenosine phosphosulfate reductase
MSVLPQPETLDLDALNGEFENRHALDIIERAVELFGDDFAVTSSFGADSAVMLHLAVTVKPDIKVVTVDTGFLFPETVKFRNNLAERLNLNMHTYRPALEKPAFLTIHGKMWRSEAGANACCAFNKQEPMDRAKKQLAFKAWMTGVRREQSFTRKNTPFVQLDADHLVKFCPIADWTNKDVHYYLQENDLPYHPLRAEGYLSIGCQPEEGYCTKKVEPGQDPRAGRWAGFDKTECGLHTFDQGTGI